MGLHTKQTVNMTIHTKQIMKFNITHQTITQFIMSVVYLKNAFRRISQVKSSLFMMRMNS